MPSIMHIVKQHPTYNETTTYITPHESWDIYFYNYTSRWDFFFNALPYVVHLEHSHKHNIPYIFDITSDPIYYIFWVDKCDQFNLATKKNIKQRGETLVNLDMMKKDIYRSSSCFTEIGEWFYMKNERKKVIIT